MLENLACVGFCPELGCHGFYCAYGLLQLPYIATIHIHIFAPKLGSLPQTMAGFSCQTNSCATTQQEPGARSITESLLKTTTFSSRMHMYSAVCRSSTSTSPSWASDNLFNGISLACMRFYGIAICILHVQGSSRPYHVRTHKDKRTYL
ncbi:hypothetical protein GUJ93_ZPchr0009g131 [Zizania palustris]|uniref:Uncharacterized protein n=1 Tax=Zizania palustris TaxID=103762 RepID=A0A8J5VK82_ZIZPA|nr:hypothetical protein GUJ93_ZPchr0009g131 [Zizania palustris]